MIGFNVMVALGWLDAGKSLYGGPRFIWLSALVGGAMFGFGMVLGSGCGSKTLVRIGGGNVKRLEHFRSVFPQHDIVEVSHDVETSLCLDGCRRGHVRCPETGRCKGEALLETDCEDDCGECEHDGRGDGEPVEVALDHRGA